MPILVNTVTVLFLVRFTSCAFEIISQCVFMLVVAVVSFLAASWFAQSTWLHYGTDGIPTSIETNKFKQCECGGGYTRWSVVFTALHLLFLFIRVQMLKYLSRLPELQTGAKILYYECTYTHKQCAVRQKSSSQFPMFEMSQQGHIAR